MNIVNIPSQDKTYVFIDGNYLRRVADDLIGEMFGEKADLNFDSIRPGPNVRRVFYYDCLNDLRDPTESQPEFEARVAKQETMFGSIQSLRDFHVRLGTISGNRRKLRQKKVDVLLVVDALEHAFRGNMSKFCLIAGDLDFAPLVDCLVRLGTYVEVIYERSSAAVDLYRAADSSRQIDFSTIYSWSTKNFQMSHPIPQGCCGGSMQPGYSLVKSGFANGKPVRLYQSHQDHLLVAERFDANNFTLYLNFSDPQFLEKYFQLVHFPLNWS